MTPATFVLITILVVMPEDLVAQDFIHWNSPELQGIREGLMKAYSKRGPIINRCNEKGHRDAQALYAKEVSDDLKKQLINEINYGIVNHKDTFFVGLAELLASLSGANIKEILISDGLAINSIKYMHGLTGRVQWFHLPFTPSTAVSSNYTDHQMGYVMDLVSCFPLLEYMHQRGAPKPIILKKNVGMDRSQYFFLKMGDGIAGTLRERHLFAGNEWLHSILKSAIRSTMPPRKPFKTLFVP